MDLSKSSPTNNNGVLFFSLVISFFFISLFLVVGCTHEPIPSKVSQATKEKTGLSNKDKSQIINKIRLLAANGRVEEAMTICNSVIEGDSTFIEAIIVRADMNFQLRRVAAAFNDIEYVIKTQPENSEAYRTRGIMLKDSIPSTALSDIEMAIKLDSTDGLNFLAKGIIEKEMNQVENAKIDFIYAVEKLSKTIENNKASFIHYFSRALATILLRSDVNVCSDLRKAIELGCEPARNIFREHCVRKK